MWNRQSPAWLILRAAKLLSAATAAVGVLAGLLLIFTEIGIGASAAVLGSVAAVVLTSLALLLWQKDTWRLGRGLSRRKGIFSADEYRLVPAALTALEIRRSPVWALFRAVRVVSYTSADAEKGAEKNSLLVNKEIGRMIAGRLMPMDKGYTRRYSCGHRQVLLMALSGANFFSGLLLVIPLISWTANNIDRGLSERLYSALENTGQMVLPQTSPLLASVAVLPVVGWLLHFAYTFLAYSRFRYARSGESMIIGRGVITRRTVCFHTKAVTAMEIRYTLLTRLDSSYTCSIIIPGFGRCVLIPAQRQRELSIETAVLFPHGEPGMCISSAGEQLWCRWWLLGAAAVLILTARMALGLEPWRHAIMLCGIPAAGVLLWRAAVGALAGRTAQVRLFADSVELTGVRGLSVCRLRVLRGSVAQVCLRQNVFQQASGLCSMYIRPVGEKRGLWCRHLPLSRCQSLIGRLG